MGDGIGVDENLLKSNDDDDNECEGDSLNDKSKGEGDRNLK